MYCKKCGTRLGEDVKFCPSCGTPVRSSGASRSKVPVSRRRDAQVGSPMQRQADSDVSSPRQQGNSVSPMQAQNDPVSSSSCRQWDSNGSPVERQGGSDASSSPQQGDSDAARRTWESPRRHAVGPRAVISLILGILALIIALIPFPFSFVPAIILAIIAIVMAGLARERRGGTGIGRAGFILAIIAIVVAALYILLFIVLGYALTGIIGSLL